MQSCSGSGMCYRSIWRSAVSRTPQSGDHAAANLETDLQAKQQQQQKEKSSGFQKIQPRNRYHPFDQRRIISSQPPHLLVEPTTNESAEPPAAPLIQSGPFTEATSMTADHRKLPTQRRCGQPPLHADHQTRRDLRRAHRQQDIPWTEARHFVEKSRPIEPRYGEKTVSTLKLVFNSPLTALP